MIRIAFTMIGGRTWTGGYNYLLNLVRALADNVPDQAQAVLFFGTDLGEDDVAPFELIGGVEVVRNPHFNESNKSMRLMQALITGRDKFAAAEFRSRHIDVVFESAQFFGWQFPVPAVAWFPDFQHRYLRHLFSSKAYWMREIGFRSQIMSNRQIMLSSEDARSDCERFYHGARGRTHVVSFAVPADNVFDFVSARKVADQYGLPEAFFFLPNQFWKHKNHKCVIQALQIVKARGYDVVVAVSGKQLDPRDAAHFPDLQSLIRNFDLEHNFRLLGLIPHAHILALMRSCSALINPSTFEGWSTTVEEAKGLGTPMILSSLRVHKEQNSHAIFFDADSPEQLAEILIDFVPLSRTRRAAIEEAAYGQAADNMRLFARQFSELMQFSALQK